MARRRRKLRSDPDAWSGVEARFRQYADSLARFNVQRRETLRFANSSLLPLGLSLMPVMASLYNNRGQNLTEFDDRRRYHPAGSNRPAMTFSGPDVSYRARGSVASRSESFRYNPPVPAFVGFRYPHRVLICVRRQRRREVFHALGLAGGSGYRKGRRGPFSDVRCR